MKRGRVVLRAFGVSLSFLTRLPVSVPDVADEDLGRATMTFPIVGALLGLGSLAIARLLAGHLAGAQVGVVVVAWLALISGGLHLDGLADVFDGLGGSRGDRARFLEIMRDSRIGALGATALVLGLLAKVFAIAEVAPGHAAWSLILAPAVARAGAVLLIGVFPYARPAGLGAGFRRATTPAHVLVALFSAAVLVGVTTGGSARGVLAMLASLGAALGLGALISRRLGGLTGDVYGAAIEVAEIVFLSLASVSV